MKWQSLAKHKSKDFHQPIDFYKLHYAPKNDGKSPKRRARSLLAIRVDSIQVDDTPKHKQNSRQLNQPQKKLVYTFQQVLSPAMINKVTQQMYLNLPVHNIKQLQQYGSNHSNVKAILQRSKEQKIKMNKLILSHKQSEQVKLEYLQNRNKLVNEELSNKIRSIYQQFFKKQYQLAYSNQQQAYQCFNQHIHKVMQSLSQKIFQY